IHQIGRAVNNVRRFVLSWTINMSPAVDEGHMVQPRPEYTGEVKHAQMTEIHGKKTVAICDTQPITAEGLRILIADCPDLEFGEALDSLDLATALVRRRSPDILIVDKGLGMHSVLDWLNDVKIMDATPAIVIWGVSMTEAEALRFLQSG